MKRLSSIGLVQWFLYENEDFPIALNTAFLGPNGTGKTCLLDAVQTVMLGADQNRLHFNAQAEGKKRDRSLRSYCLGVVDDGPARNTAATYVLLTFREEASGEVVTAGVALSARVDSPDAVFHGLFLLPGLALTARDFLQREAGREVVIPWREAQLMFRERAREVDAPAPIVTTNRDDFVRRLLLDHLAARGDRPNTAMFRNAFQRSVHLKVMDDLNASLRDHLIEAHPTRIRDFRERAEQFRRMRDLVARIREQIAHLERVDKEFGRVRTLRVREANYLALAATLQVEALGERESELEDALEQLARQLAHATTEEVRSQVALRDARTAEREAIEARALDPKYQAVSASSQLLHEREKAMLGAQEALAKELQRMWSALTMAADTRDPTERGEFEAAAQAVKAVIDAGKRGEWPDSHTLQHLGQVLARAAAVHQRHVSAASTALEAARHERNIAKLDTERADRGLGKLEDNVATLQLRLQEEGITATPVCDLVEVADREWQPVMEAYLGRSNVQALLVSSAQEEKAVATFRAIKRVDAVYGAKIAAPSRIRSWKAPGAGQFAAALVTGADRHAVDFLRGELGRIECVASEQELLRAGKAFTKDGMIATGGGIDRRPVRKDGLRLGRQNREAARAAADHALRAANDAFDAAERTHKALAAAAPRLQVYASADTTTERISQLVTAAESEARAFDEAHERQRLAGLGEASALDAFVAQAQAAAEAAHKTHLQWHGQVSSLTSTRALHEKALFTVRAESASVRHREREARAHVLYDANEVERLREREEGETGPPGASVVDRCRDKAATAGRQAGTAEGDATGALSSYILQFNANVDLPGEWMGRAQLVAQELHRLQTLTLAEKQAEADAALQAAERVFRSDVVHSLLAGFQRIKEQIDTLNLVLRKAPEFSNQERYHFAYRVIDLHKPLHRFLEHIEQHGTEDSLFSDAERLPPEFRALMEADASSPLLADTSPLYDCRRFFSYDVEIMRGGQSIGHLSKRFGPGSGGEHRTPLYVIFGAALAAAYGNLHAQHAGGGLMLLDEAFDKMDATNVRAVAEYLNALGLQLLMAGPETDQTKLSSFLHSYFDLARHGSRTIHVEHNEVGAAARDLLASDNPLFHPELLQREIRRLRGETDDDDDDAVANVA